MTMKDCKKCNGDGYNYEAGRMTPTRCECLFRHCPEAPCSDYECGDEVTIEGHGKRTVNAQIGEYLFLDTDTDGPFIDTVHVSFVQNK